jgi:adenylate cyclase
MTTRLPNPFRQIRAQFGELVAAGLATLLSTALIAGVRGWGGLQFLELSAYDQLWQWRPDAAADPRILIVGITEADLQAQGGKLQLPDATYAQLFAKLQQARPRVIGLDIWRDRPVEPGHAAFTQQLQSSDRIIGITFLGGETLGNQTSGNLTSGNQSTPSISIAPPAALPPSQIGFNDVIADAGGSSVGGVIRRNLLYQTDSQGQPMPSFALQVALRYLKDQQITDQPSPGDANVLQLGATTLPPLPAHAGGYAQADTRGYQVLLNYRGRANSFPQVSLTEVLTGQVPAQQIQERIVLIGNVAESGKDFFYTPFSASLTEEQRMPGVLLHAHMISQLLDAATGRRPLIWYWNESLELAWIASWALLGVMVAWKLRHPLGLSFVAAGLLASLAAICVSVFVLQTGWIPLVPSGFAFILGLGGMVTYTAQQAKQQQQMVMRLLGQNTSPEIAETFWQRRHELLQDGKLPGQRLIATILFTDLKGFSSISEQLSPEALLLWLNEYLEEITQVVQLHNGVINKFTGDGIMAVFGVPLPRTTPDAIADDAQQAVACALAMGNRLARLNQTWQQRGLPAVEMRAGIFTGPIVVGSLGGRNRLEYGVIGDSVNIASRLESLDKHRQPTACRVLIAQETLDYLQGLYEVEAWGALELKGKKNPVQVYRVIGAAPSAEATLIPNFSRLNSPQS